MTIAGSGFDATASRNTVVFNNGAVGTVTAATSTQLSISFSVKPATAGRFTAVVTVNGASSGTAVQIANVSPVVTTRTTTLASSAASFVISGFGFDPIASRNTVVLSNGAVGTVTDATTTSLTVRIDTKPTSVGSLTAIVTTNSISSGNAVQVANVIPSVTSATTAITLSTTTLTIRGFGFSTTAGNNTVVFNNGAVGTVTNATATTLTVSLTTPPKAGNLTAIVTTNSLSSGAAVQVATLAPTVTVNTSNLAADASTVTIAGTGFDTTALNNRVVFNNGAIGTVTNATSTELTVTLSTRPTSGSLTAVVTTNGASSGTAIQVGAVRPLVTVSTTNLARTAATIVINGFGFSTTASRNTVVFNNGAIGTVTAATGTRLTVTFSTKTTITGSLTAVITSNSISSGTPVQVANMT
jgi:preprotein translocase subunit YajC